MDENEKLKNWRNKLIFRSGHRGTKEMDLLLGSFAEKHVPDMNEAELKEFEELLTQNDPDLYNWITGQEEFPANLNGPVLKKLKAYKFA